MISVIRVALTGENCHIVGSGGGACFVVDPGGEPDPVVERLGAQGLKPIGIVITHGHFDHTAGISGLIQKLAQRGESPPIAIHRLDSGYLGPGGEPRNRAIFDSIGAWGSFSRFWTPVPAADILLEDGDRLFGSEWRVIHTPGHSPGSICLYHEAEGLLVSGDTLFAGGGRGRTDIPEGDEDRLMKSIEERLFVLPESTKVYPGHGPLTTIGKEKKWRRE